MRILWSGMLTSRQTLLRAAVILVTVAELLWVSIARKPILVVGSLNVDRILRVERLPVAGETITANGGETVMAGGKGLNQAVAVARLRACDAEFVGRLGNDAHADWMRTMLVENGVGTTHCEKSDCSSGIGLVLLQPNGIIASVVVGGSNAAWPPLPQKSCDEDEECSSWWADVTKTVHGAAALLLQREIPEFVNEYLAKMAFNAGVPIFQDIGGEDRSIRNEHLAMVDFISPNLSELQRLVGATEPLEDDASIIEAARSLQARGAKNVLVTLGGKGSLLVCEKESEVIREACCPIPGGVLVDETGAGDSFRAAFAVSFVEGKPLTECLRFAAAAGSVAVSRLGATPSLPNEREVVATLRLHPDPSGKKLPIKYRGGARGYAINSRRSKPDAIMSSSADDLGVNDVEGTGISGPEDCPWQFASRLNSMKDGMWRWDDGATKDVREWITRQATIRGLTLIDFNYPQHIITELPNNQDGRLSVAEAKGILDALGLAAGAVCLRYSKEMQLGAMTNPDPEIRQRAIDLTIEAGRAAEALGANELVVWSAYCGYDYSLQVDYDILWRRVVEAFQEVCDACPTLRVSLEFKPTDENTRFFAVPSTGAALLLVHKIARPNMGLTIDVGHCLAAGENPAQSVAMVGAAGKLFGVQLNDGYQRIGAEDGLMFGSVHPLMALELCVWLVKTEFKGHIYFDTFPRNEDPIREAEYNIRTTKEMWAQAQRLLRDPKGRLAEAWKNHDAITALELFSEVRKG